MKKTNPRLAAIYLICSFTLLLASPVIAQENRSLLLTNTVTKNSIDDILEYAKFKDWFLECRTAKTTKKSRCELITPVLNGPKVDQNPSDISLKLIIEDSSNSGIAVIQTPLELLLSKGIKLEIDNKMLGKLTYRSCHVSGCLAPFSVSGGIKRAMLNGISAKLTIFDLEGKARSGSFSLLGISNAMKHTGYYFKQN